MSISLKKNDSPAPATTSRSKDKKTRHFPGDPRFGVALSAVDEDVTSLPPLRTSTKDATHHHPFVLNAFLPFDFYPALFCYYYDYYATPYCYDAPCC
jgi:hypothetical protein